MDHGAPAGTAMTIKKVTDPTNTLIVINRFFLLKLRSVSIYARRPSSFIPVFRVTIKPNPARPRVVPFRRYILIPADIHFLYSDRRKRWYRSTFCGMINA